MREKDKGKKNKKNKVLIENYNRRRKELEIGALEKTRLTSDEIESLLMKIPSKSEISRAYDFYDPYKDANIIENPIVEKFLEFFDDTEEIEDYGFHPKVITKDFVISRLNNDSFEYLKKNFKLYFLKIPLFRKDRFKLGNYPELGKRKYLIILLNVLLPFLFPGLFITFFLWSFFYYVELNGFNLFFMLIWGWFFLLAVINLWNSIKFHYTNERIEYYNPLLRMFKPYDLSKFIILAVLSVGVLYISFVFLIFNLAALETTSTELPEIDPGATIEFFSRDWIFILIGIIGVVIIWHYIEEYVTESLRKIGAYLLYSIIAPFQIVYIYYKFNKTKKRYILHNLHKHIAEGNIAPEARNYYLHMMFEIDKTPIVRVDLFTKLVTGLTFLFSTIPPFISQFL